MASSESTPDIVEQTIQKVASKKDEWHGLSYAEKASLLRQIQCLAEQEFDAWGKHSDKIRDHVPGSPFEYLIGWGYFNVSQFGSALNDLIRSYDSLASTGAPMAPLSVRRSEGHTVAHTFPVGLINKATYMGAVGEVWFEPGVEMKQTKPTDHPAGVCVVLGPGNFEAFHEPLQKLFVDNKVVIFKSNPVNQIGDLFAKVFAPLVERGYAGVVDGDAKVGALLTNHPLVDELLMTGGCATYDRIVWGAPTEQAANKLSRTKLCSKPFEAELGAASPYIIVPGVWTDSEIKHHANMLAAAKLDNGSHYCASAQVIVTDREWPQREAFLNEVRNAIRSAGPRNSYYPGIMERYERMKAAYPNAELLSCANPVERSLPVVFATDVPPDSVAVHEEAFCPVLVETCLDTRNDPARFVLEAVDFVNKSAFGSLSGTIIMDPRTEKQHKATLEKAIANMKYGSVGVNIWGGIPSGFGLLWGAYPGHPDTDIQSGCGKINNAYMFDRPSKFVLRSPFIAPYHTRPCDATFAKIMKRSAWMCLRPSVTRLVPLATGLYLNL